MSLKKLVFIMQNSSFNELSNAERTVFKLKPPCSAIPRHLKFLK